MELILALIGGVVIFVIFGIFGILGTLAVYGRKKNQNKSGDEETIEEMEQWRQERLEERRIYIENKYKNKFLLEEDEKRTAPNGQIILSQLIDCAENNDASAAFSLGEIYRKGLYNVQQNLTEALKWYRKSNLSEALFWVGFFIGHGLGTGKRDDWDEAEAFLLQAANLGNVRAMEILGDWYFYLSSYEAKAYEGEEWHRKAADRGSIHSASRLADFYSRYDREKYEIPNDVALRFLSIGTPTLRWIPGGYGDAQDYNEIVSKYGDLIPEESYVVDRTPIDRRIGERFYNWL